MSDAIATGQRAEKIVEANIQQAEIRRRGSRREHFDSSSRQMAQLLAKDMNTQSALLGPVPKARIVISSICIF